MWFAVDDQSAFHRKVLAAGNEAWGVFCRAGAWSSAAANLTEGYIPPEICEAMAPARVWKRLRAAGLTEAPSEGRAGEQLHDFLVYNRSAAEVRAHQEAHRERTRRWRDGKRDASRAQARASACALSPVPVPVPELHTPLAGAREEAPPEVPAAELPPGDPPALAPADLIALLTELTTEGHAYATDVAEQLAQGRRLTHGQREALRRIQAQREREAQGPPSPRGAPAPTDEERAVVAAYCAEVKRVLRSDLPELDRDLRAARRLLPDLRKLAEQAAVKHGAGWTPSPADVARHYLASYLRLADPRLAEQGYPLAMLLARVDLTDLPRPPRAPREKPPEAPPPVDPEANRAAARTARAALGLATLEGFVTAIGPGPRRASSPLPPADEAAEIAAAREELLAMRPRAGGAP
jgi:hypothetical protein